jgi:non-ribosomal peptide synthetase-like protein
MSGGAKYLARLKLYNNIDFRQVGRLEEPLLPRRARRRKRVGTPNHMQFLMKQYPASRLQELPVGGSGFRGRAPSRSPIAFAPVLRPGEPYARDELLYELLAATCRHHAARPALRMVCLDAEHRDGDLWSYAELQDRSLRLARHLRSLGIRRGDRVVICLPRGLDQYMAIFGVLAAGATYVPVDWTFPQERIDFIAADCDAALIVTLFDRSAAMNRCALALDLALGDIAAESAAPLTRAETGAEPDDLAYIIYTSGTTGRPKGVMIRHRNICHLVRSESAVLALKLEDRIYGGFSLAFDMSIETMWSAFFVGAELIVASEALSNAGPDIAETLARERVTILHAVPSLLAILERDVPTLRMINLGGEACPRDLVRRWARPGLRLLNTYGPTETSVTATWTELRPGRPVTIGRPLPGYTAWIVDERLQPVPPGAEGELVIGGLGVAAGYLNRSRLTAEKFMITPFDGPSGLPETIYRSGDLARLDANGEIEFIGRVDTQVKIRGFRVEVGEVEALLAEDPAVAQAVIKLFKDDDGSELLVAFLVARPGASLEIERLRAQMRERLPSFMRPAVYQQLDALPMFAASGKVDRNALVRPAITRITEREVELPATPLEAKLHGIWVEIFAPTPVSVIDDFFEGLGGHSLKAARMVSAARRIAGLETLSIQDLYAAPTIRALAERLEATAAVPSPDASFHRASAWTYRLCAAAQTVALLPIFTIAGMQWFFPYIAYIWLVSHETPRLQALLLSGFIYILLPVMTMFLSIAIKWLVIGRFRAGDYPLWGSYYFRWWFVRRVIGITATPYLAGTPMIRTYYRMLGATIGRDAYIGDVSIDAPDLVTIGDGAIVNDGAVLASTSVERGLFRVGTVDVGAHAFIGNMTAVGRNAIIGDGAVLKDLSALPAGKSIPAGECWNGSPARANGPAPEQSQLAPVAPLRRTLSFIGLLIAALVLPLVAILPIAPGIIALIEIDWATTGYSYVLLSPLLALAYVILMCLLTIAAKWLILGRVKPGVYSRTSWFYIRYWFLQQINDLALSLLHPIYATLYVAPWYRALGVKVGHRAEISTASEIVPDLVEIGPESFIADAVVLGAAHIEPGAVRLEHTRIGRRSFIGNSALLPTGSVIGDEVLLGVLSKPPEDQEDAKTLGSTWFGSPAIRLPNRQICAMFDEGARFNPSRRLVATRLAIEYVRVTLSLTVFLALFSLVLSVIGDLSDRSDGMLIIAVIFPLLYVGFAGSCGLFVLLLKWTVIGRYRPTIQPLWSTFVWRAELVTSTYENLAVPNLLGCLQGTPWLPAYLRLLGCRIGRRCYIDTTDITEFDLVRIGDDVVLNEDAGLQTHLFEDRVMKVGSIEVGDRAMIGSLSIVLYDAEVGADAQLGDLTVVMKGETLPPATAWEGSPAQPARTF